MTKFRSRTKHFERTVSVLHELIFPPFRNQKFVFCIRKMTLSLEMFLFRLRFFRFVPVSVLNINSFAPREFKTNASARDYTVDWKRLSCSVFRVHSWMIWVATSVSLVFWRRHWIRAPVVGGVLVVRSHRSICSCWRCCFFVIGILWLVSAILSLISNVVVLGLASSCCSGSPGLAWLRLPPTLLTGRRSWFRPVQGGLAKKVTIIAKNYQWWHFLLWNDL